MGYEYNLDELMTAMRQNVNLTADKGIACRRFAEELIDKLVADGDASREWDGLLDNSAIPKFDVAANANGDRSWEDKSALEIIKDFNAAISGVYIDSRQVEQADTVLLPVAAMDHIDSMPYRDMTVGIFLQKFNAYTRRTGRPITMLTYRGLETAAAGGLGRLIAYRRAMDVLKFHLPMPYRFLPVFQESSMRWVVDGIMRIGGLEIRLPNAIRYGDRIWG